MFYCEESEYLRMYKMIGSDLYFFRGPITGWVLLDLVENPLLHPMTLKDWNKAPNLVHASIKMRHPDISKYVFYLELLDGGDT